jgi:hypothetical protein
MTEYDPPAMERFMRAMKDYIVDVKGVRPKHPARNCVEKIPFKRPEQAEQYKLTWERYEREMILLKGGVKEFGTFQQLVAMMKFSQSAELIRHEDFGDRAHAIVSSGKCAVIAVKFKETIAATVKYLAKTHGYKRSDISIIWGGMGGTFDADGRVKLREKRVKQMIFQALRPEDLDLLKSLNIRMLVVDNNDDQKVLKTVELSSELEEREKLSKAGLKSVDAADLSELQLGTQSSNARQREIDNFQKGKTRICLFTFKAGGVGLSLHHNSPDTLPRETVLAPCYSAIEMVQGLGRAPRLTSMSETIQTMLFYKGTIEEHIADRVSQKLRCLREVVRQRESWEDVIVDAAEHELKDFTGDGSKPDKDEVVDDGSLGAADDEDEEGEDRQ